MICALLCTPLCSDGIFCSGCVFRWPGSDVFVRGGSAGMFTLSCFFFFLSGGLLCLCFYFVIPFFAFTWPLLLFFYPLIVFYMLFCLDAVYILCCSRHGRAGGFCNMPNPMRVYFVTCLYRCIMHISKRSPFLHSVHSNSWHWALREEF